MIRTKLFTTILVLVAAMAAFSNPTAEAVNCECQAPDGAYSMHRGPCNSSDPRYCRNDILLMM
ncbi:hypothetical protein FBU30_009889 [Linnemannia zychae]|nr:hypothetical protein FBU30_009889 [Linnemannia zychae]